MPPTVHTGAVNVEAAELRKRALALRKRGLSFQRIADEMGCSVSMAYKRVRRAIAAITLEDAEEVQKLELVRLDQMLAGLCAEPVFGEKGQVVSGGALDGDPAAVSTALRLMERRAKLLGLDAPDKHRLEVDYSQLTDAQLEEGLRAVQELRKKAANG